MVDRDIDGLGGSKNISKKSYIHSKNYTQGKEATHFNILNEN
jgi:hypothetical protein